MANAREIQGRIKSIKDTMKITNAMYMVSSSKLQKARKNLKNTQPYFNTVQESLASLLDVVPEAGDDFFDNRSQKSQRTSAFLIITADKGLAGAYNHNVTKLADSIIATKKNSKLFIIGNHGKSYYVKKYPNCVDNDFFYFASEPSMETARELAVKFVELFDEDNIDDLYVVYTEMINSMQVEAKSTQLLPLKQEKVNTHKEKSEKYENVNFYPSAKSVFNNIVPDYIAGFIYGALVESYCSEQNARMMAMQSATDSATDMIRELSIQFNRARQAAITQEITEVISGSKSQKNK